ncbi:MAG: single-stranded DNA-binding protein [Planctomycetes bacterium]|nr:single-stranded DNA-binding protein [Planctomycetota bacterium]
MASFNKVILMGNLTRTPELRSLPSGTQLTDITLAVNENYTDKSGNKQESTHFVEVTFWGKQAELICRWKKQGDPLLIEGSLKQDKWVDKETGKNRSKLKVQGSSCTFLNRGSGESGGGGGGGNRGGGRGRGNQGGGGNDSGGGDDYGGGPGGYDDYATSLPESGGGEEPPF